MDLRQRGTTIVETMITLTIVTVMIGLVSGAIANYLRITAASRNTVEIVGQHEKVLRMIRNEFRQTSANRSSKKRWWIEDGGSVLKLQKLVGFDIDAQGKPLMSWSEIVVYSYDTDGYITRTHEGESVRVAGNIKEIKFTEIDNGRLMISLTNQTGSREKNTQMTLTTAIEITPQN